MRRARLDAQINCGRFHPRLANLRVREIEEIKSVPYAPVSHPFVERLIRTYYNTFPYYSDGEGTEVHDAGIFNREIAGVWALRNTANGDLLWQTWEQRALLQSGGSRRPSEP
jgi:hypothetical protein